MKKAILITSFAALSFSASAQKLEKPKIDKIKGDTTWSTSEERLYTHIGFGSSDILYQKIEKIAGVYTLVFKIDRNNGTNFYGVRAEDITNIKFSDSCVLNLQPTVSGPSDVNLHSNGHRSIGLVFYALNQEQLVKLSTKAISFIRISSDKGDFDYEIKGKNSELIKNSIELITKK